MLRKSLLAAALLSLSGCRKHESAATRTNEGKAQKQDAAATQLPPEQAAQIEAQFLPPAPTAKSLRPGASIQEQLDGAVHAQLTAKLRVFKAVKGRMPENFYELANTVGDGVPPLPEGMKFAIDPVDQTVKAVRK